MTRATGKRKAGFERAARLREEFARSGLTQTEFACLHGLSSSHISRLVRGEVGGTTGPLQPTQRLTGPEYVIDLVSGCWVWQRGKSGGYGHTAGGGAHRVYYERAKGMIPPGLQLDHLCRNPSCVNPDHLEPVTGAVNVQRGAAARLTPKDVERLRRRAARGVKLTVLAREARLNPATVSRIVRGLNWRNVDGPRTTVGLGINRKLTDDDARTIRERYAAGAGTVRALCAEYGVAPPCIIGIVAGTIYQSAGGPVGTTRPGRQRALSPDQVREIRTRYSAGGVSTRTLAAEYAISSVGVFKIVTGRTYREVE